MERNRLTQELFKRQNMKELGITKLWSIRKRREEAKANSHLRPGQFSEWYCYASKIRNTTWIAGLLEEWGRYIL